MARRPRATTTPMGRGPLARPTAAEIRGGRQHLDGDALHPRPTVAQVSEVRQPLARSATRTTGASGRCVGRRRAGRRSGSPTARAHGRAPPPPDRRSPPPSAVSGRPRRDGRRQRSRVRVSIREVGEPAGARCVPAEREALHPPGDLASTEAGQLHKLLATGDYTEYSTQYVRPVEPFVSVPHALLALLSDGPKYGLRLQNEFESRTGEVWPLNVGQVYTTLQRLERDGLVETDDGESERSRKRYRITSTGHRELADWLRTPPDLVPPPRDELVIKVLVALQIPVIDIMQRYTQVKAGAGEDDMALALVADAELFRLEAIIRWLDAADVRLKQQPTRAPAAD